MENIKTGLIETLGELKELLALCETLGLDIQERKISDMIGAVTNALEYIETH